FDVAQPKLETAPHPGNGPVEEMRPEPQRGPDQKGPADVQAFMPDRFNLSEPFEMPAFAFQRHEHEDHLPLEETVAQPGDPKTSQKERHPENEPQLRNPARVSDRDEC